MRWCRLFKVDNALPIKSTQREEEVVAGKLHLADLAAAAVSLLLQPSTLDVCSGCPRALRGPDGLTGCRAA